MKQINKLIKIVIADDHEIFRDGFRSMVASDSNIQLVGEAVDGSNLLQVAEINNPDIILTDIRMPVMDGIEATKLLSKKFPHIGIIALSMFNEDHHIMEMLAAGAKGYLLKDAHNSEIIDAIKSVNKNQSYFCNSTAQKVARMVAKKLYDPKLNEGNISLSGREKEVLKLVCAQKCNKEISVMLNLSVRTVEGLRTSLLNKTNSQNIAGLVIFAIRYGIYIPG